MRVSTVDLDNVIRCIEETIPNASVYIDFSRSDSGSNYRHESVSVSIRDEENCSTLFSSDYDDIFQAYPILLGIYYGMSIAKDKPFDYSPTPGDGWDE